MLFLSSVTKYEPGNLISRVYTNFNLFGNWRLKKGGENVASGNFVALYAVIMANPIYKLYDIIKFCI
jgi:hypothetical protein